MSNKRICRDINRRRFSDDQIKSLETIFESESRPTLHMKQQLANRLGLHPRQVAIWFQNKRARSKSKLVEQEYATLKTDYDTLASEFESLKKENQTLLNQLQRLRKMSGTSYGEDEKSKNQVTFINSDNQRFVRESNSHDSYVPSSLNRPLVDYLEEDGDVLNMAQIAEVSLTSPENGCSYESCTFLDTTSTSSKWWDLGSL